MQRNALNNSISMFGANEAMSLYEQEKTNIIISFLIQFLLLLFSLPLQYFPPQSNTCFLSLYYTFSEGKHTKKKKTHIQTYEQCNSKNKIKYQEVFQIGGADIILGLIG